MSLPSSTDAPRGGPYRKPRADTYTTLLVISLLAIVLGILCLYLEMSAYEFKFKGGPTPASIPANEITVGPAWAQLAPAADTLVSPIDHCMAGG